MIKRICSTFFFNLFSTPSQSNTIVVLIPEVPEIYDAVKSDEVVETTAEPSDYATEVSNDEETTDSFRDDLDSSDATAKLETTEPSITSSFEPSTDITNELER